MPGQDLFGIEKLNLNSEANAPSTARSKLCFDLHQAAGLPAPYANHVATLIIGPNNHRSGPNGMFFDAVPNNTQPVDDVFVKQRFANTRGNLYKCTYASSGPANRTHKGPTGASYSGLSTYELKYQGGPDAWGNDHASWTTALTPKAPPGLAPLADADADGLPDACEMEWYGGMEVVGSSPSSDADNDGATDLAEHIAGTSATNAHSRLELNAARQPDGRVVVQFQTQPISGAGYFGRERRYPLEQSSGASVASAWTVVPDYFNLPAPGDSVSYTNLNTNTVWIVRVRVSLD